MIREADKDDFMGLDDEEGKQVKGLRKNKERGKNHTLKNIRAGAQTAMAQKTDR